MSLQDLSDKLKLQFNYSFSRAGLSHIECGKSEPSAITLYLISKIFGVKMEYFFDLAEPDPLRIKREMKANFRRYENLSNKEKLKITDEIVKDFYLNGS